MTDKYNIPNIYVDLIRKIKQIEGVDIEYIDQLVELLYQDINRVDDVVLEILKLIPDNATEVNKLATDSDIPAAQVNSDWNANSGVAQILNKPTIPAAQVNSDWNANSGVAQILNKPRLPYQIVVTIQASSWSYSSTSQAYVYDYQLPNGFNESDIPWIGLTGDNPNYNDYSKITKVLIYEMRPIAYVRFKASVQPDNDMMIILLIP